MIAHPMRRIRIQEAAAARLDEIYQYTHRQWGEVQAKRYITTLFEAFEAIDTPAQRSRPVPAEFGVQGFYFRCQKHIVYWRRLSTGEIGIVTVLHERMHQMARFQEDDSDL